MIVTNTHCKLTYIVVAARSAKSPPEDSVWKQYQQYTHCNKPLARKDSIPTDCPQDEKRRQAAENHEEPRQREPVVSPSESRGSHYASPPPVGASISFTRSAPETSFGNSASRRSPRVRDSWIFATIRNEAASRGQRIRIVAREPRGPADTRCCRTIAECRVASMRPPAVASGYPHSTCSIPRAQTKTSMRPPAVASGYLSFAWWFLPICNRLQ